MIRRSLLLLSILLQIIFMQAQPGQFIHTSGKEIIGTDGRPFLIKGTNLGNWLVPEGYMFKFKNTNSPRMIHETIAQLVGPAAAAAFWKKYLDNYITAADIHYLKTIGVNSVRLPFNYRLFTSEDYLGANDPGRGFQLLDKLVAWCKKEGLFIILDMHCAPGGQTGDNIDDGWGYPFLFESEESRLLTIGIWRKIAERYRNETTIMGYDLLNEPIAHYFDVARLNPLLEPFYRLLVQEIRAVDTSHIVFLGGAQWNTNFKVFGEPFDPNVVYTFHKYGDVANLGSIQRFIDFREKYNVPIYAGETGENTDEWVGTFRKLLEDHHIGWHFWPYKKMESTKNILSITKPAYYDSLVKYAESPRTSFKDIRTLKPNAAEIKKALEGFLNNCLFEHCTANEGYIRALGLQDISVAPVAGDAPLTQPD
ncbi:MAG: cellulase family glycosylhydrolase [Chitinophagaceae bacterium]